MAMILFFILAFLAIGGMIVLAGLSAAHQEHSRKDALEKLKLAREQQKLQLDSLRAARLLRDQVVVENRAHLVASQQALTELKIELLRKELGMNAEQFRPDEY